MHRGGRYAGHYAGGGEIVSESVIQIDTQAEIEKIIRQLDTLPNRLKAPSVLAAAINAAANEMKRKIGQKTRKRYAISDKKILTDKKRGGMYLERAKGADTSATLISRGGMVEVMAYMTRRNTETTAAMLKAGADFGATGENPAVVACRDADLILGPIGIVLADALLGEVKAAMAAAVSRSRAHKILIPLNRCGHTLVGVQELPLGAYIDQAAAAVRAWSAAQN